MVVILAPLSFELVLDFFSFLVGEISITTHSTGDLPPQSSYGWESWDAEHPTGRISISGAVRAGAKS